LILFPTFRREDFYRHRNPHQKELYSRKIAGFYIGGIAALEVRGVYKWKKTWKSFKSRKREKLLMVQIRPKWD